MNGIFNLGHLNVRSLPAHYDDVKDLVILKKFDIVSETWLSSIVQTSSVNIEGYVFVRRDRRERGGGVGLYIANHILYTVIPTCIQIEQLWIKIKFQSLPEPLEWFISHLT